MKMLKKYLIHCQLFLKIVIIDSAELFFIYHLLRLSLLIFLYYSFDFVLT